MVRTINPHSPLTQNRTNLICEDKAVTNTNVCIKNEEEEGPIRKEMFYLTTHSTHFIYGYIVG